MSIPVELIANIGSYLDSRDIASWMVCNKRLFSIFAPSHWSSLKVSGSNVDSLLHLIALISQGQRLNFLQFAQTLSLDRTSHAERPITAMETTMILSYAKELKSVSMITPPLTRQVNLVLRRLERDTGMVLSMHVMCQGKDPGDFSKFKNVKSLILENVYEGIDHLIPLPESVEHLDIRAHSTCAYSQVLGKFMSKCTSLPVLRISELSIGIDRQTAWIPESTTRLELFDCQILVSNTIAKRPVMNGIKTLRILDDYSKIDMVLPDLETLELCKHTTFLSSIKPENTPRLCELVFSDVPELSIIHALHSVNLQVMDSIERVSVAVRDADKLDALIASLNEHAFKRITLDVSHASDSVVVQMKNAIGTHGLQTEQLVLQSTNYDDMKMFSNDVERENGIYRVVF